MLIAIAIYILLFAVRVRDLTKLLLPAVVRLLVVSLSIGIVFLIVVRVRIATIVSLNTITSALYFAIAVNIAIICPLVASVLVLGCAVAIIRYSVSYTRLAIVVALARYDILFVILIVITIAW